MVESAPASGLPPMHIGVHTGPVVFQDGDVYGRTVNLTLKEYNLSHATGRQLPGERETTFAESPRPAFDSSRSGQ